MYGLPTRGWPLGWPSDQRRRFATEVQAVVGGRHDRLWTIPRPAPRQPADQAWEDEPIWPRPRITSPTCCRPRRGGGSTSRRVHAGAVSAPARWLLLRAHQTPAPGRWRCWAAAPLPHGSWPGFPYSRSASPAWSSRSREYHPPRPQAGAGAAARRPYLAASPRRWSACSSSRAVACVPLLPARQTAEGSCCGTFSAWRSDLLRRRR